MASHIRTLVESQISDGLHVDIEYLIELLVVKWDPEYLASHLCSQKVKECKRRNAGHT
jgi:hypothetical protein